jgi:hypothetical protein
MSIDPHSAFGVRKPHVIRAIGHIEHYANQGDFVSEIGVLNSSLADESIRNRFMGRVFVSPESGHLLNQHYLHQMFTLSAENVCLDHNEFMDMQVDVKSANQDAEEDREDTDQSLMGGGEVTYIGDSGSPSTPATMVSSLNSSMFERVEQNNRIVKVKQLSRLWLYRNGGNPADEAVRRAGTI